jgi:hypothetical protein
MPKKPGFRAKMAENAGITDNRPVSLCAKQWPKRHSISRQTRYSHPQNRQTETGDQPMRLLIATAIIISATIGLGGCFGHHEKAVVVEPLKLG